MHPTRVFAACSSLCQRHAVVCAMLGAAVFSTACALIATDFVALSLPLEYDGDSLLVWIIVKTLASHAWVWANEALGYPAYMEMGHFPMSFVGQLAALKVLVAAGLDPITTINVYAMLTFTLTAVSATWAMGRLGVQPLWSAVAAAAYSLLPYHFLRIPGHLFLAGYYMVPLGAYVLMRLDDEAPLGMRAQRRLMALCAGTTLFNDVYYTFFLGYLIAAAAMLRLVATGKLRRFGQSLQMLGAMLTSCAISMLPALWTLWRPGAEPSPLIRPPNDSETYGLKLIQMLLPIPGHRNPWMSHLTQAYTATAPLITENQTASLGIIGAICFVVVCVVGLRRLFAERSPEPQARSLRVVERLALFILFAFVFGTIGGLGAVLSYTTTTFIRCTNRIVIFIAFFALSGGMLMLQHILKSARSRPLMRSLIACGMVAILFFDVTDVVYFPNRLKAAQAYKNDQAFFAAFEAHLPAGARIFELPYVTVIEGGFGRLDYVQALPYLHTRQLQYSFGAFRDTCGDRRNYATSIYFELDDSVKTVERLRAEGFDAVLLNRGLPIRGNPNMPRHISNALGPPRESSPSKQFVLFDVPKASALPPP